MKKKRVLDRMRTDEKDASAQRLIGLLMEKHQGSDCAFFTELPNAIGFGKERTIDAYAMELWQSKKFARTAYEVKISKADYLYELSQPEKREPFMQLSNWFYFVTPVGMVDPATLPEHCGLLEGDKGGLKTKRAAAWREIPDMPLTFMARLMRAKKAEKFTGEDLRLFKYAGREMTQEEFYQLLEESRGVDEEVAIRKKVKEEMAEWLRTQPGHQICEVILQAMGRVGSTDHTPKEVRKWLQDQRSGVPASQLVGLKLTAEGLIRQLEFIIGRDQRKKARMNEEGTDGDGGKGATAHDAAQPGAEDAGRSKDPDPKDHQATADAQP